ncbi:hypothetical protein HYY74_05220 [Candidatus Woesearchaeota archaeon]|nr:hypothetical protein [Candidatus Woesearchaeota archaeon]
MAGAKQVKGKASAALPAVLVLMAAQAADPGHAASCSKAPVGHPLVRRLK